MMNAVSLVELNSWLTSQLDLWNAWAVEQKAGWLQLPTGNERFTTTGELFRHAMTPLRRYSDQAAGQEPADDSQIDPADWPVLQAWAASCLQAHRRVCAELDPAVADEPMEFKTRSAGVFLVSRRVALGHAATHCFWHLGGIAHLLRARGIAPPQRSDLLWWGFGQAAS